jgi:hypothetical protein
MRVRRGSVEFTASLHVGLFPRAAPKRATTKELDCLPLNNSCTDCLTAPALRSTRAHSAPVPIDAPIRTERASGASYGPQHPSTHTPLSNTYPHPRGRHRLDAVRKCYERKRGHRRGEQNETRRRSSCEQRAMLAATQHGAVLLRHKSTPTCMGSPLACACLGEPKDDPRGFSQDPLICSRPPPAALTMRALAQLQRHTTNLPRGVGCTNLLGASAGSGWRNQRHSPAARPAPHAALDVDDGAVYRGSRPCRLRPRDLVKVGPGAAHEGRSLRLHWQLVYRALRGRANQTGNQALPGICGTRRERVVARRMGCPRAPRGATADCAAHVCRFGLLRAEARLTS